jgi:hypothetical protein
MRRSAASVADIPVPSTNSNPVTGQASLVPLSQAFIFVQVLLPEKRKHLYIVELEHILFTEQQM